MQNSVVAFLGEIDMLQYATPLLDEGFDDLETLLEIEDDDLAEIGMPRGHVIRLRKRMRELAYNDQQQPKIALQQQPVPSGLATPSFAAPTPRSIAPMLDSFGVEGTRVMQPTAQMTSSVQQSWDHVQSFGSDVIGTLLYRNLFELAPEAVELFPRDVRARYQHWTIDEAAGDGDIMDSPALGALFGKVINAVGMSVAGLHETEALVPRLKMLGMRHANYNGVQEAYFPILQKAMIRTLKGVLGDTFTPEVEFAWTMVYGFISAIMCSGMREAREMEGRCQQPQASPVERRITSGHEITNGKMLVGGLEPYRIERHLQKAIYGDVFEAIGVKSMRRYALKTLDKDLVNGFNTLKQQQDHQFCESPLGEVQFKEMMRGLDHVMQLQDNFSDDYHHFVVSELAAGGDLLDALRLRPSGFPEQQAQQLVLGAAKGLASLHLRGLAMQDVSVENLLLHVVEDGSWHVKVCDPGQASAFVVDPCSGEEVPIPFKGFVGKDFRPPELYTQESYLATKVDAWCLGWSTFYLLVAQPMFHSAEHAAQDPDYMLFEQGQIAELFQAKGWSESLSGDALDFILGLMQVTPTSRMSVRDALRHPWLASAAAVQLGDKADCYSVASAPTDANSNSPMSTSCPSTWTEGTAHSAPPQHPTLLQGLLGDKNAMLKSQNIVKESACSWALS